MVLDIIKASDFKSESAHADNMEISEDQWLYQKMLQLPLRPDGQNGARLPSVKVATSFSVETIWYDRPFGYGHVRKWGDEKTEKMDRWCPEHRLAQSSLLSDDEWQQLLEQAEPLSIVPSRPKQSTANRKGRNGGPQAILQP
jgi:hypothetical protein